MLNNMKHIREAAAMSQSQLADLSGVPQSTIARLEKDPESDPKVSHCHALASALGVTVDELFPNPFHVEEITLRRVVKAQAGPGLRDVSSQTDV